MSPAEMENAFKKYQNIQNSTKFNKIEDKSLIRTFSDQTRLRSSLSLSLRSEDTGKPKELVAQIGFNNFKKKNLKKFRVYFFNSDLCLDVPIEVNLTVGAVIKQIMDYYYQDKTVDNSLLKYPKDPEAYELRMLDDDFTDAIESGDSHLPDFSLPPFENNRVFASLCLEKGVAFVENPDYKPVDIPVLERSGSISKFRFMERIATQNKKIIVTISSVEEKFKTSLQLDPELKVKDIYPRIAVRVKKISERYHNLRIYTPNNGTAIQEDSDDDDSDILDDNLPLKALKSYIPGFLHLEIIRKRFSDQPPEDPLFLKRSIFGETVAIQEEDFFKGNETQTTILYNEVTASHYEEFNVVKLNKDGKGSNRVLGIDAVKVKNLFQELKEQNTGLTNVFSYLFFSKITPKHPERPLSDLIEARLTSDNRFATQYKAFGGKRKVIEYEAPDFRTAYKIVSKLEFLKNLERKRRHKSGLGNEFSSK